MTTLLRAAAINKQPICDHRERCYVQRIATTKAVRPCTMTARWLQFDAKTTKGPFTFQKESETASVPCLAVMTLKQTIPPG